MDGKLVDVYEEYDGWKLEMAMLKKLDYFLTLNIAGRRIQLEGHKVNGALYPKFLARVNRMNSTKGPSMSAFNCNRGNRITKAAIIYGLLSGPLLNEIV